MLPISCPYKAIFCDLYGTIFDISTHEDDASVWEEMRAYMNDRGTHYVNGAELYENYLHEMNQAQARGERDKGVHVEIDFVPVWKTLYERSGAEVSVEEAYSTSTYFHQTSMSFLEPYSKVREFLAIVRRLGLRPILVSNAQASYTRPDLKSHHLTEYFDRIFLSSDFGIKKPDARFFQHALDECGLSPHEVVYMGNEIGCDVLGARGVQMDAIYLHTPLSVPGDPARSEHATLNVEGADYEAVFSWLCKTPVRIEGDGTSARIIPVQSVQSV